MLLRSKYYYDIDEDGEYLVAINVSWWLSEIVATFLAANSQLQYSEVSAVFAAG